jgi:hypothetical protein
VHARSKRARLPPTSQPRRPARFHLVQPASGAKKASGNEVVLGHQAACPDQLALGIDHAGKGRHFDRGGEGVGLVPSTDPGSGRSPAAPPGEGRPSEPWPTGGACRRHEPLIR